MNSIKLYHYVILSFTFILLVSCNRKPEKDIASTDLKTNEFKVVGYLGSSNMDQLDRIDLSALTHLNLAFANPDSTGTLVYRGEEKLAQVVKTAHEHEVKVFISIAGGSTSKDLPKWWLAVLQPDTRSAFVKQIVDFVLKYHLDGVDVDIEWNVIPTIGDLYEPFVIELKNALKEHKKGITSALNVSGLHESVTQEALLAYDFINVMVYDKTGPWRPEKPGQHAPYSYAEEALEYWTLERKIPSKDLTLGVPFYGHDFDRVGSIKFADLVDRDTALAYKDQIDEIYYNGIPTMIKKTELALDSYGGIMIWELAQDAQGELSLLKTIKETIDARQRYNEK